MYLGLRGATPPGAPRGTRLESVRSLATQTRRPATVIVIGSDVMEATEPSVFRRAGVAQSTRVLLCGDSCAAAAAVRWIESGAGEFVREADLARVLADAPTRTRPADALVRVRRRFAAARMTPSGRRRRANDPTALDILAALPRTRSMNNAAWAAAIGVSESTLDRWCRNRWNVPPGVVLDVYAAAVIQHLTRDGVEPDVIAGDLGYAHRKSLAHVLARVRR